MLAGDLTIKEVTRPVELDVACLGVVTDPWGGERAVFSASAPDPIGAVVVEGPEARAGP
jgi:polyisoprenoid-binding protein YceI